MANQNRHNFEVTIGDDKVLLRDLPNSLKAKEVFSVTNIEPLTINGTD